MGSTMLLSMRFWTGKRRRLPPMSFAHLIDSRPSQNIGFSLLRIGNWSPEIMRPGRQRGPEDNGSTAARSYDQSRRVYQHPYHASFARQGQPDLRMDNLTPYYNHALKQAPLDGWCRAAASALNRSTSPTVRRYRPPSLPLGPVSSSASRRRPACTSRSTVLAPPPTPISTASSHSLRRAADTRLHPATGPGLNRQKVKAMPTHETAENHVDRRQPPHAKGPCARVLEVDHRAAFACEVRDPRTCKRLSPHPSSWRRGDRR